LNKILPLFSYIFHPLFVSVYAVLLFFIFGTPYVMYPQVYFIIAQTSILTIFLPISCYYLLLSLKKVDSIMIADVNQRKTPLLIHAILLLILIKKGINFEFYPELYYFFLGSLISTLLAFFLIYLNTKASLHMIGITALTVFTIGLSIHFQVKLIYLIAFLILCNGLIASSRLVMKAHTYKELIIGGIVGLLPQIALLHYWI